MIISFTICAFTWCYPHEQVFAGSGLALTRSHHFFQWVKSVEVDKVGAAEAGDDWEPASVQRLTGRGGGE